ncbi:MAG TPA: 6-pyruvoyl-tetrahydropterin synthase-related protein [Candidatus Acidoferrum sp.]
MTDPSEAPYELTASAGRRAGLAALGVSLAVALLIIAPFFWLGNASGHDIAFHASSWLDVAGQWKEGIVFPRWSEWANNGFGEPRFIFYPPLSWMLGAALGFLVPWKAVPGTYIVLVQTLAGISMFLLARRFFPTSAALFAAACYAANPYAQLVVYMRSDFAEELACSLLPLLLLAALELCGVTSNRWRSGARATAIFALLFASMWLSNAPAGVLASYSTALLFAWAGIARKSFGPLWRGAAGLALGLALSGFYLFPAAYEQRWVNIGQALSSGLQPAQNFLFTRIADPEHNLFNWIASTIAVLLMALTGASAVVAHRNTSKEEFTREKKTWQALLLLSAAAMILMLHSSSILWERLPKLRFVQFPWRWMGILAVPYAFFSAAAVRRWRPGWVWAAVVTITVVCTGAFLVHKAWWDSNDIPVLQEAISSGKGFDGTDEYDPAKDDHTDLPAKAPRLETLGQEGAEKTGPNPKIQIARWTAEEKELIVTAPRPLRLAIRLLDYPAWRVEMNGRRVLPESPESTAQIILPLPAGTQHIRIKLETTLDRRLGGGVSLAGLLALAACFLRTLFLSRIPPAHRSLAEACAKQLKDEGMVPK